MNTDMQALAIPVLAVLAIVGGALVGWALGRRVTRTDFRYVVDAVNARLAPRDNPDPSDSAGA